MAATPFAYKVHKAIDKKGCQTEGEAAEWQPHPINHMTERHDSRNRGQPCITNHVQPCTGDMHPFLPEVALLLSLVCPSASLSVLLAVFAADVLSVSSEQIFAERHTGQ